MGEIIISPWLVWLASVSPLIIAISMAISITCSIYLIVNLHTLVLKAETIPYYKTMIGLMIVAYLILVLTPSPSTIVRMAVTNYITVDTTNTEYELLIQRVSNLLGVKTK